ncbi:MAG: alpha/beta hydrolase [Pseudomonadales bacterium]|nr:alpha/beta hydrolase [Pseudomonadales bacterium]
MLTAFLFTATGCYQEQAIQVTTTGLGNNDEVNARNDPSRAWIIAGIENPEIEITFSFQKQHPGTNTELDIDSIELNLDSSKIQETETNDLYSLSFAVKEFSVDVPSPNDDRRRTLKSYEAQARYGSQIETNHSKIEVLRPYCEVNSETEWNVLGMTFETPTLKETPNEGWPTILLIHGGGRKSGDHTMMEKYAEKMLEHGFAVANINYSLININGQQKIRTLGNSWKDPLSDTKCAIRYLKENAYELRINPQKIGISGHSDGAILAIQAALTATSTSLSHIEQGTPLNLQGHRIQEFTSTDTSVNAVFAMDLPADSELGYDILLNLGVNSDQTIEGLFGLNSIAKAKDILGQHGYIWNESTREIMNPANPKILLLETLENGDDFPPLYMSFSNRLIENTPIKLSWYKHGCSLYQTLPNLQHLNVYMDELDIHHNEFITNSKVTERVAGNMVNFFGLFLGLEGPYALNKTSTYDILQKCGTSS